VNVDGKPTRTVTLSGRDAQGRAVLELIDQPKLPWAFEVLRTVGWRDTAVAIRDMTVRGAGAIGVTGAAGMAQAACEAADATFWSDVLAAAEGLRATRPTAQNLFYGIDAVLRAIEPHRDRPDQARAAAFAAAKAVEDDDAACCEAIGRHGRPLLRDGMRVSTHCNAGWLAFVDWGSAISPIYAAHRDGLRLHVWVDETRPRGQGARLTAWELAQEGVPHQVVTDGVIGSLMRRGQVDLCIVGSDRIAANGDVANKVGTYTLATLAKAHGVPFYVAAPTTTIDPRCPTGDDIPIEHRSIDEVHWVSGPTRDGRLSEVRVVNPTSDALNPAFDVTPAALVAGIITERGIVPATPAGIASVARS
jgi:methylthioribose-1-phosphate isomerase